MKKIRLLFLTLVALIGAVSASASKTVYIQPNGWTVDNAKLSLWIWQEGSDGSWATLNEGAGGCLTATFDDNINRMIFVRGSAANDWDAKYNQTANIDLSTATSDFFYMERVDNNINVGNGITNAYVVNFNTSIATNSHDFQVASNWSHIVGSGNYDGYGPYYMSYSYYETAGVDGTGCLSAGRQYAGDNWGGTECTDLLITPEVKGEVTLAVKKTSSSNSFIEFYTVTGTDGAWVQGESISFTGEPNQTEFTTVTLNVGSFTRIGIRASNAYIDNFTAEEANIIPEKKITIASAEPSATTGTIKWEQQANGKVLVKYTVTVTNNGEVDLTQGMDGFSVSIVNGTSGDVVVTTPVPQNLAIGETSEPFDVQAEVETTLWPNSYTHIKFNLRENLKNSLVQRAQSDYTAYEPKFVFRESGSTSTSSIIAAESWGTIIDEKTKSFEIANTGTAPLTIKSVTLPDGFKSDNAPATEFVLAKDETCALNITQDATVQGTFAGTLSIVYLDKNGDEQTYNLNFSTTVIGANTWTADFNNSTSTAIYPEGSIKEGVTTDWDNKTGDGKYNIYLKGYNSDSYATENNKFITPKLHANAGDKLAFDVKAGYSDNDAYFVKVYKSTDRKTWGEPVETYVYSTTGSSFTTKTISFDAEGDYYVAFAIYGTGSGIDNLVGLEKVDVAHDLYIKSVSWPNASIKSGTAQSKPSVDIIPLTNETVDNYTVKYIYGENEVAIASKALTANASSTTNFAASFTPEVAKTTTFPGTKVVFEFTDDGTKFETETFDLTVTNEPIFHFLNTKYTSRWYEPSSDYSTPYNFGKTNSENSKTFWILNWGSAPLTVKSIAVPEGFTASVASMNLPAFDGTQDGLETCQQSFDITFTATEAGTYNGNLVVTYVDANGDDQTYELAISGTKLDPTKWYANFGGESNQWPAGSVYQDYVSTTYVAAGDYAITSTSTTKNLFITPKLTATAGEKLAFDAKIYSGWSEGKVVVYAAATRDELVNFDPENDTRNKVFTASGTDATNIITTDYQTFEVPAVAGDMYYAFEISNRPYVDEIYGLKVADVAHDWTIASPNIPAEGMQNKSYTASVNIVNLGIADEDAADYTVTAYVDDKAAGTGTPVAIPMSHKLTAAGTQLSVSFIYPKTGTVSVYLKVESADGTYSVQTDPVYVTFAEEVASGDAIEVGSGTTTTRNYAPIDFYNYEQARTSDILYTAAQLNAFGLKNGDKITTLTFKGTAPSTKTIANSSLKAWVAPSSGDITYGSPDKAAMTEITVFNAGEMAFVSGENLITINLPDAITYDGTSDLRIYLEGGGNSEYVELKFAYDTNYSNMKWSNDVSNKYNPLLYVTLAPQTATLSGTVTDGTNAVEGATVTLVSTDGDNIQYTGTTDAEGAYSINVIQAARDYNVTVTKEGLPDATATVAFGGENKTKNFYMVEPLVVTFVNGAGWENVNAYTYNSEQSGTWPGTGISKTGTTTIQGVEYDVYTYSLQVPESSAPEKIIFNNGGSGDGNQTANLDFANSQQYVYGVTYYSVAGAFQADGTDYDVPGVFGTAWATELNDMTMNAEGLYELSFKDISLPNGTHKFKVLENHAWTPSYPASNYEVYVANAGTYDLTITFDATGKNVSHKLTLTLADSQTKALDLWPNNTPADVTVARTLKAGWNAMVLPFDVTAEEIAAQFGANAQVAEFTGDEQDGDKVSVNFAKSDVITANVPFLLYLEAAPGEVKFLNKSVTFAAEPKVAGTKFDFVGLYADGTSTTIADGDYIMAGGMLKCAAGGNAINAYRSYLKLKEAPQPARISIFMDGELIGEAEGTGEATGINGIGVKQVDGLYNMGGQKVTGRTKKGVYIQNGKKVVIK